MDFSSGGAPPYQVSCVRINKVQEKGPFFIFPDIGGCPNSAPSPPPARTIPVKFVDGLDIEHPLDGHVVADQKIRPPRQVLGVAP